MNSKRRRILLTLVALVVIVSVVLGLRRPKLVLTGIVTTDEVIVGSQIDGRIAEMKVEQGQRVKKGDLLAVIAPEEMKADFAYAKKLAEGAAAQTSQAETELSFEKEQASNQVKQAEANKASADAQVVQAKADLEMDRLNLDRAKTLRESGTNSQQDLDLARTGYDSALARANSVAKQAAAAEAAVALARSGELQVAERQSALEASRSQLDAAKAQADKAAIVLGYTELRAPADGIVNVRAALQGEVVNPGTAVVTLINPADLWVRADVEETYIDRIHLGDTLLVRLPSGAIRQGKVFFRGIDADYATQRDVSRTKRDIKTFELRVRCDNSDEALAVGMTAFVILPFSG